MRKIIVLGLILALIGWLTGLSPLVWIGIVLVVVGLCLLLLGTAGPVGGRWW